LESVALEMFQRHGFDHTTVDDIAQAAGVGRRTFFRYFSSKNDVAWGAFEESVARMRDHLARSPDGVPLMVAVRRAVLAVNRVAEEDREGHRRRMELIMRVPALQAHSALRYAAWRQVIADFAGARLGRPADALTPQALAHATLGVAVAAYDQWLRSPDGELTGLLDDALRQLAGGFPERAGEDAGSGQGVEVASEVDGRPGVLHPRVDHPSDQDGVVTAVVPGEGLALQHGAGAGEHRVTGGVGDELAPAELVGSPGGEPNGEVGVLGRDDVHHPAGGPEEDRVALGALGQADQHQRRVQRQ
jgi:mycofactocin system transcriptional regulator